MDTFSISGIITQTLLLGLSVAGALCVFALIGLGPVLLALPGREAMRWPLYAPLAGLAIVTFAGLSLSLLGLPVNAWNLPLLSCTGLFTAYAVWRRSRVKKLRKTLLPWVRRRWMVLLPVIVVPVAVSAVIVSDAGKRSSNEIWGSGDYGAYWVVADYLTTNGARVADYENQNEYRATDVYDHLTKHARLGCMVSHSFLASIFSPDDSSRQIIPLIVASIVLMILLAVRWLEKERVGGWIYTAPLLTYPFLYFLLYFTYLSQATGVILFGCSVVLGCDAYKVRRSRDQALLYAASGIFLGASLLHYPSLLVAGAVFFALLAAAVVRSGFSYRLFIFPAAALVVCAHYLPMIVTELSMVGSAKSLPGWEWNLLLGALEFFGLRPLTGTIERDAALTIINYVANPLWAGIILYALFATRMRLAAVALALTTAALAAVALMKYREGIPYATHAFIKSISTFSLFLFLVILVTLKRLATWRGGKGYYLAGALSALLLLGHAFTLGKSLGKDPWCGEGLVTLSKRMLSKGYDLAYTGEISWEVTDAIVRNSSRKVSRNSGARPYVILMPRSVLPTPGSGAYAGRMIVFDTEGDYAAVRFD